ncbi:MAG: glycine zipper family protein [Candidatus Omnitrophota bacterium]|nr:glycine zipper family protein [Candidatus Omnitrophota bacterium]
MKARLFRLTIIMSMIIFLSIAAYAQDDDSTRNILKEGLLGAGTGAIASGASGGNAGQGALIGAGTGIIGGALLDAITAPPRSQRRAAPPPQEDYYYDDQDEPYYEEPPPQQSSSSKVLKQGLLGAGTGAIASGASGGNAGQGALIGAGTGVIGGALLDTLTQPAPKQRRVYRKPAVRQIAPPRQTQNVQVRQEESVNPEEGRKKIIKKYDSAGKLVSEEEIYY